MELKQYTMEHADRNLQEFRIVSGYKDNDVLRKSLNTLTAKVFGFHFEQWYRDGYWQEKYVPYSITDGQFIAANISVNFMDFIDGGAKKHYIQLGTVMTDPAFRGRGLSRILMEKILDELEDQCELFYLFANDTVLDFYPRFGFVKAEEYQYSKMVSKEDTRADIRKLDMSDINDRNMLYHIAADTVPLYRFSMTGNPSLIMFHCTNDKKDSIYYLKECDTVVIAEYMEDRLYIEDVFCTGRVELGRITKALPHPRNTKIILGFTPEDAASYQTDIFKEEGSTLFIRAKNGVSLPKVRFSALSHA